MSIFDRGVQIFIALCSGIGTWITIFGVPKWAASPIQGGEITPWWAWALIAIGVALFLATIVRAYLSGHASRSSVGVPPQGKVVRELSRIELAFPTTEWDKPLENIFDKKYRNEVVLLDGRHFIKCIFENVTFLYNGMRPVQFKDCKFGSVIDGKVSTDVRTDNAIISATMQLLEYLGVAKKIDDYRLIKKDAQ